ncbi:MAG: two-component regulator propeller domain-containing protein, partial [Flavobacteriaceae bacterium]
MLFSKLENGLFNEWISSITQDSHGFIWVGTQDGLHRYDGYKFEVIRNSPENLNSPAANWIQDIAIDSKNNYWLATYGGGLSKFSAKDMTFQNFETDSLLPSQGKQVYKVAIISDHQLLTVSDEGFHLYDSNTNKSTNLGIGGLLSCVTQLGNEIWLSDGQKLFVYNQGNQNIEHFKTFDSDIFFLHNIPELGILVGFKDQLLVYKNHELIHEIALDETIIYYTSDGKGNSYLASRTTLFKFNNSLFQITAMPIDLDTQNQKIESIFLDRQGTLWVGTDKGLFKEKKFSSSFLPEPIELHARSILKHNETWYIGGLGGLFSVTEGKITSIIKNKSIQSIKNIGDTILASTYQTEVIRILKSQPFDTLLLPIKPDTKPGIFGITSDKKGRLWIGTWEGLYVYDRKKSEFKNVPLDSEKNVGKIQIVNIRLDKKDRLWVFTSGNGIYKLDNLS